ncbi:hypothetical protein [Thalassolituus sp.]|jgi:hypothetical protein|uniref:hypothetical protein n=1 Tax=Thalassolituus sp. TaxID=2030822 RepID=UPI00262C3EA1|nr:hypothetical protein [uncultured Thalassolituus sp.]TNC91730.1 MAG: hypothetical protein CSH36_08135 [Thalassolituus sp.]
MRHITVPEKAILSASRLSIAHEHMDRFDSLDNMIRNYHGEQLRSDLLNDFIDTGLELATDAGNKGLSRLQESWLRRIYTTLRDSGINSELPAHWRQACLESLYQPFFALQHIYQSRRDGRYALRYLSREMQVISGYLL